jgi:hypothetical protein
VVKILLLPALAVFDGIRVAIGLAPLEADRPAWFRDKRQRGEGGQMAQAAGPLARRRWLSLHGNKADRILRKSWGVNVRGMPLASASPVAARAKWSSRRTPSIPTGLFSMPMRRWKISGIGGDQTRS